MKVGQPSVVLPPEPPAKPASTAPTKTAAVKTSLSSVIGAAKQAVEDTRVARVQELAAQVRNGSYQPNPQVIAQAILDDAIVDAELEAG